MDFVDIFSQLDITEEDFRDIISDEESKESILNCNPYISEINITDHEIQNLINQYSGTGDIEIVNPPQYIEICTCNQIVGTFVSRTGQRQQTNKFKIHYGAAS